MRNHLSHHPCDLDEKIELRYFLKIDGVPVEVRLSNYRGSLAIYRGKKSEILHFSTATGIAVIPGSDSLENELCLLFSEVGRA